MIRTTHSFSSSGLLPASFAGTHQQINKAHVTVRLQEALTHFSGTCIILECIPCLFSLSYCENNLILSWSFWPVNLQTSKDMKKITSFVHLYLIPDLFLDCQGGISDITVLRMPLTALLCYFPSPWSFLCLFCTMFPFYYYIIFTLETQSYYLYNTKCHVYWFTFQFAGMCEHPTVSLTCSLNAADDLVL